MDQVYLTDNIYDFWFGPNANTYSENYKFNTKLWFHANIRTDAEIKFKFGDLVDSIAKNPILDNAKNALCSLIVLDQFPRHIHRVRRELLNMIKWPCLLSKNFVE